MRIPVKTLLSQLLIIFCVIFIAGCRGNREEEKVIPPITSPLSNEYIGFGVITDPFTHVSVDPEEGSLSLGYLRRGSIVRIIRRQTLKVGSSFQTWVYIDDPQSGWLKESIMDIYDSESQAKTASNQLISN